MTFIETIDSIKKRYPSIWNDIIFEIIYKLSKLVKTNLDFTKYRNYQIDFKLNLLKKYIKQYLNKNKPIELISKKFRFYGLDFKLYKGVLIPRPDSEILCEKVIKILSNDKKIKHAVDLCCGSGCLGIVLKKHIKSINMDGIDIQSIACKNTLVNADKHNVKINIIQGDFYKTLINKHLKYDLIVCNPPYVSTKELDKSMIKYENKINFNNNDDPLFFYKTIIKNYKKIIRNKNHFLIAFEIGYNQKNNLIDYLQDTELFNYTKFYNDYGNKARVMIIYKI